MEIKKHMDFVMVSIQNIQWLMEKLMEFINK